MHGTSWETLLSKMYYNSFIDNWSLLDSILGLSLFFYLIFRWYFCPQYSVFYDLFLILFNCAKCVAKYAHPEKLSQPIHISKSSYICVHDLV